MEFQDESGNQSINSKGTVNGNFVFNQLVENAQALNKNAFDISENSSIQSQSVASSKRIVFDQQ